MTQDERKRLIQSIQEKRNSQVVVYCTGDRAPGLVASIAETAVRPLYDHLLAVEKRLGLSEKIEKIDLFLYSRGGDVSVPWRIVSMIREFCEEFSVLVPYRAQSAATMICLGADEIVMGRKAELGPIDPTLMGMLNRIGDTGADGALQSISTEDVSAYVSFMRERANINDQVALAQVVSQLSDQVTPLTLGGVYRTHSHIRLVARKLLTSHRVRLDEEKISGIVAALTEKIYSHGHGIARAEAADLGLRVAIRDVELEDLMWQLYLGYEELLDLRTPFEPMALLAEAKTSELRLDGLRVAIMESLDRTDMVEISAALRQKRIVPSNLQVNANLNLQLPAGIDPAAIPSEATNVLQQLLAQLQLAVPLIVQQEIVRQSPVTGWDFVPTKGDYWQQVRAAP